MQLIVSCRLPMVPGSPLVAPCLSLPSIEDVFGTLWKTKNKEENKSQIKKERVKRQQPGIGDGSSLPWAATADS